MKNITNKDDESYIEDYIRDTYSAAYHALKAAKHYNFSVGDIVIKNSVEEIYDEMKDEWSGKFKLQHVPISRTNRSPKKFKVVAVDEFGIPWIRQINSSTGKLGNTIESLAEFNFQQYQFTPDKSQADSILVGGEGYDPLEEAKQCRKHILKLRRENAKKLFTSDSSLEWGEKFKSLKRSQECWFSTDKRYMGSNGTYFASREELEERRIRVMSVTVLTTKKEVEGHKGLDSHDLLKKAREMIKAGKEVVVMKYLSKDHNGNWLNARDAYYATNIDSEYYYHKLERMCLYVEEPEVESETK